jgi:hypothetical protein
LPYFDYELLRLSASVTGQTHLIFVTWKANLNSFAALQCYLQKLFIFGKILCGHSRKLLHIIWLRLAALCPCAFALSKVARSIAGERHLTQRRKGSRTQRFSMLNFDAFALDSVRRPVPINELQLYNQRLGPSARIV